MGTPAPGPAGGTGCRRRSHPETVRCRFLPDSALDQLRGGARACPKRSGANIIGWCTNWPSPAFVRHSAHLSLNGRLRAAAARAGPTWKMGRSWAQTLFSLHLATRVISRPPGDTPGLHLVSGKFLLKFFSRYSPCSPPPIPSLTPFFASFSQVQQHQSRRSSSRAGSRGGSNSRAGAAAAEPAAEVAATAEPAERRRRRLWRLWRADSLFFV